MKAMKKVGIAAAVCVMGVSMANADLGSVVSFNVDNNGTISKTDSLGAVAVTNWYNTWNGSSQDWFLSNLQDQNGTATGINIGWVGNSGDWSVGGSKPDANSTMLNGYCNGAGVDSTHAYVQNLNAAYTYNVYLYFNSDNDSRVGYASTDANSEQYYFGYNPAGASGGGLIQATDTTTNGFAVDANYAMFTVTGVTNAQFFTSSFSADGVTADYGGVAGIQVQVQAIPEPATLGLIGIFGAGLLFARRRFMI